MFNNMDSSTQLQTIGSEGLESTVNIKHCCQCTDPKTSRGILHDGRGQRTASLLLSSTAAVLSVTTLIFVLMYHPSAASCQLCAAAEPESGSQLTAPSPQRLHGHQAENLERKDDMLLLQRVFGLSRRGRARETVNHNRTTRATTDTQTPSAKDKMMNDGRQAKVKNKRKKRRGTPRVVAARFIPINVSRIPFPDNPVRCVEYAHTMKVCRNDTAKQIRDGLDIDVMEKFWQQEELNQRKQKKMPFVLERGRAVRILQGGIYFIYGKVGFLRCQYRSGFQIYINQRAKMNCVESKNPQSGDDGYQTCEVTGVFYLQKDDRVHLRFPYSTTQINLNDKATYFGLARLSK